MRYVLALLALLVLSYDAPKAFWHGVASGGNTCALSKNIVTDYSANDTGLVNAESSFADFNADVLTWQGTNTGLVCLTIPAGVYLFSGMATSTFTSAIKQLDVSGYGATLTAYIPLTASSGTTAGGTVLHFGSAVPAGVVAGMTVADATNLTAIPDNLGTTVVSVSGNDVTITPGVAANISTSDVIQFQGKGLFLGTTAGQYNDINHDMAIQTAMAGASNVTLTSTTNCSTLFHVGDWDLISGINIQNNAGYPTNPYFYEYVTLAGVNCSTGVLTLSSPLQYTYLSTWPNYGASAFEVNQGGPGTIYALNQDWYVTHRYRGITLENYYTYINANGYSMTFDDCTFVGPPAIPSQNVITTYNNCAITTWPSEVDKLYVTVNINGGSSLSWALQSGAAPTVMNFNNHTTGHISGTPSTLTVTNGSVISELDLGAFAYGASLNTVCTDSTINSIFLAGSSQASPRTYFAQSGGVITVPDTDVSAFALAQTRVSSGNLTANGDQVSGGIVTFPAMVFARANFSAANDGVTVTWTGTDAMGGTISDMATLAGGAVRAESAVLFKTLTQVALSAGITGTVSAGNSSIAPLNWAVPGGNVLYSYSGGDFNVFQITGMTQDSFNTYVATTMAGGFPTPNPIQVQAHGAPNVDFTNCTGTDGIADDLSQAAARNRPFGEYSKLAYDGSVTDAPKHTALGQAVTLTIDVTRAYTGAPTLTVTNIASNSVSGGMDTSFSYNPVINLKQVGRRVITYPSTVTCDGVAGSGCSGDSGLNFMADIWWTGGTAGMTLSRDISSECLSTPSVCPIFTVEFDNNQGVVLPP